MDGEAVTKIEQIVSKGIFKEIGEDVFSPMNFHKIYDDPRPDHISVSSLESVFNFMDESLCRGEQFPAETLIVKSHRQVHLVSPVSGESNKRLLLMNIEMDDFESYPFGRFVDHEEFVIKLASMFEENEDLEKLMFYTSKIGDEASLKMNDDGITQTVSIKKGLSGALTENKELPSKVKLKPFRTFSEIEQPESLFLFRMKKNSDGEIGCALFEADGGQWKKKARSNIADYFKNNGKTKDLIILV